jgi:hypothetical protein
MSRSGYSDDCENVGLWRGVVASTIRSKRGQAFLKELVEALDAMPERRLITENLQRGGEVCALGSVGVKRGVDMSDLDPYDFDSLSGLFGVSAPLIQEIEWMNDDANWRASPEVRWQQMRDWAVENIRVDDGASSRHEGKLRDEQ